MASWKNLYPLHVGSDSKPRRNAQRLYNIVEADVAGIPLYEGEITLRERPIAWIGVESPEEGGPRSPTGIGQEGLGSLGGRIRGAGCRSLEARHIPGAITSSELSM